MIQQNSRLPFTRSQIRKINLEQGRVLLELQETCTGLVGISGELASDKAREYLLHGVCRRMTLIKRCIANVFRLFPVERQELLDSDTLAELEINLHAFTVNIYAVLDNLAWAYLLDKGLAATIKGGRLGVDLFKPSTQKHLPPDVVAHLKSERTASWHERHAKDYRDALAHRIPLYIPPGNLAKSDIAKHQAFEREIHQAMLNQEFERVELLNREQASLQTLCFNYVHSYEEANHIVYFHPQMIADSRTILAIAKKMRPHLGRSSNIG